MERAVKAEIYHNARVKLFPDGRTQVLVLDRPCIRARGWEAELPEGEPGASAWAELSEDERAARNLSRAQRRARSAVYDYALATPFRYFVTLTIDREKADRYDPSEIFGKLHNWLDNCVRRKGLVYVLIPEYHKDGAVHFHALFNDALPVVDSGTMIPPEGGKPKRPRSAAQRAAWAAHGGRIVYNLPAWSWGFTTAIELHGDRRRAVGYVVKYITKADAKIGGRWYYSGGELRKPDSFAADFDFSKAAALGTSFEVSELGCRAVTLWMEGEPDEQLAKLL